MALEYRADNPKNPKYPNEDTAFVSMDASKSVYVTQSGKIFVVRGEGNPLPENTTPTLPMDQRLTERVTRKISHPDIEG